jgi:F0F1-type ATP synthase membrane subunit b/b'
VDIEQTIQFILESQAKAEIRMDRAEARPAKAESQFEARQARAEAQFEARQAKYEARQAKHEARVEAMEKRLDKRMDAITKLLRQGMRILAETQAELKELAQAQKETDRSLKSLINSLRNGRNGR